ncbi:hypothetical protein OS175_11960 [Marinicella sp. S1101]|uniref:hypothetical protein n=1 Tax=Marinicella marina TaxID=2996016 RepID=UPI002260F1F1|nr:hypothetical protein [Marinicella marina]MCX7554598.1 hypothetical protein [Marinicella marina]MDJ1141018.1 hypothetical protein [Marinicella marina]
MLNESANSKALNEEHGATRSPLHVVVLGTGNIGKQFLNVFEQNRHELLQQKAKLVAVANSRYFQYHLEGFDEFDAAKSKFQRHDNSSGQIYQQLERLIGLNVVVIDLTASESVADQYLRFAQNGWHIISANKTAAANHDYAAVIDAALNKKHLKWLKNTTVGAALPVQAAIKKIIESGDEIHQVSGVFSGSISWLLAHFNGEQGFMDWVKQAHKNALTEPDPRADLSGLDVHRKALILARECGFNPQQIDFNPVLPPHWLSGSLENFWQQADNINQHMRTLWRNADKNKQQLQYIATVNEHKITIALKALPQQHVAVNLKPSDNIFIIESNHYNTNPMVILGPGAGKAVTAAGVMSDLNELLQHQLIL